MSEYKYDEDLAHELMESRLNEFIEQTRSKLPEEGVESLDECEDCGDEIPEARRNAMKGCTRCIDCQELFDSRRR